MFMHPVYCPVEMACLFFLRGWNKYVFVSLLVFAAGYPVFEGLLCLNVTYFGYEKG